MPNLEAKVVVLGSQGVGKTSVVVRFVRRCFTKTLSPTIGASFFTCAVQIGDQRIKMQVWDTAGQERFRAMAPMYYRKANAALLIYDISSHDSFEDMRSWVKELERNTDGKIVYCLVGNKSDLVERRKVSQTEADSFAASVGAKNFEVSALADKGVDAVFSHLGESLLKQFSEDLSEIKIDHFANRSGESCSSKTRSNSSMVLSSSVSEGNWKKRCC